MLDLEGKPSRELRKARPHRNPGFLEPQDGVGGVERKETLGHLSSPQNHDLNMGSVVHTQFW